VTWAWASLLLVLAASYVLWPLLRHWSPRVASAAPADPEDERLRELEEIELDVAAGRLSEPEAAVRRRDLQGGAG
jgi:hypothetical protein